MSEYQYYEFYSIDRALTKEERKEVDRLSSRFSPTDRRAVFTYNYSYFNHSVERVLLQYFDFFLYMSSWGNKRIMYKFPEALVNYEALKQYNCSYNGEVAESRIYVYKRAGYVILDIDFSIEEWELWIEEDNELSIDLMKVREDILNEDYKGLCVLWLHLKSLAYHSGEIEEDELIPRAIITRGLSELNEGELSLIKLFEIEEDWIRAAAKFSDPLVSPLPDYLEKLRNLPLTDKDAYLSRLLEGEPNLAIKLKKDLANRTQQASSEPDQKDAIPFAELVKAVAEIKQERAAYEAKQAQAERLKWLKKTDRDRHIFRKEVEDDILKGNAKGYDAALKGILRLRDLAVYKQEEPEFEEWVRLLKRKFSSKRSMLSRLKDTGL